MQQPHAIITRIWSFEWHCSDIIWRICSEWSILPVIRSHDETNAILVGLSLEKWSPSQFRIEIKANESLRDHLERWDELMDKTTRIQRKCGVGLEQVCSWVLQCGWIQPFISACCEWFCNGGFGEGFWSQRWIGDNLQVVQICCIFVKQPWWKCVFDVRMWW